MKLTYLTLFALLSTPFADNFEKDPISLTLQFSDGSTRSLALSEMIDPPTLPYQIEEEEKKQTNATKVFHAARGAIVTFCLLAPVLNVAGILLDGLAEVRINERKYSLLKIPFELEVLIFSKLLSTFNLSKLPKALNIPEINFAFNIPTQPSGDNSLLLGAALFLLRGFDINYTLLTVKSKLPPFKIPITPESIATALGGFFI